MQLAEARSAIGVSLVDAATLLKIRRVYLEALETDDHAALPEIVFSIGFLRSYATYLGLDEESLARQFRAEAEAALATDRPQLYFPKPALEEKGPGVAVLLIAAVLLVGGLLIWTLSWHDDASVTGPVEPLPDRFAALLEDERPEVPLPPEGEGIDDAAPGVRSPTFERLAAEPTAGDPAAAEDAAAGRATGPITALDEPAEPEAALLPDADTAPVEPAVETAPAEPMPVSSGLQVHALADSWIEITGQDGIIVYSGVLARDDRLEVDAAARTMVTGNAGGVEFVLDGAASGPLGETGDVMRDISLAPDAVLARWFEPG